MSSAVTERCTLIRLRVCLLMFIFTAVLLSLLTLLSILQRYKDLVWKMLIYASRQLCCFIALTCSCVEFLVAMMW